MKRTRMMPLLTTVFLIILVIGSVYFYWIEYQRNSSLNQTITNTTMQLNDAEISLQQAKKLAKQQQSPMTIGILPLQADESSLLRLFHGIAFKTGVVIQSATFSLNTSSSTTNNTNLSSTASAQQINVTMQLSGRITTLLTFIHDIQFNHRLAGVSSSDFSLSHTGTIATVSYVFPYA
nr:hypothetical protein [Bacilli bacterium]